MSQSGEPEQPTADDPSLDQLADELAGVERALERLEDGSYRIDPVSGEPLTNDPVSGEPMTDDPVSGEPLTEDVRTDDPTAEPPASTERRAPPSSDPSP